MNPLAYENIKKELHGYAQKGQKVRLLAVSKGQPAEKIAALYGLGQRDFGENYAAELVTKKALLAAQCPEITWHFIGKIQKRQAQDIRSAVWVHTVGSEKEARYLVRGLTEPIPSLRPLLQVNIGEEPQKGGFAKKELLALKSDFFTDLGLNVQGLMCIPPATHLEQTDRDYFGEMAQLKTDLESKWGKALPELSMGMTADYPQALKAGATWIRVGTLLFGQRSKN